MVLLLVKSQRQNYYLVAGMVEEFLTLGHSSEIFLLVCCPRELLRRLWEGAVEQCELCSLRALLGAEEQCGGFYWLMLTTRGQVSKKKKLLQHTVKYSQPEDLLGCSVLCCELSTLGTLRKYSMTSESPKKSSNKCQMQIKFCVWLCTTFKHAKL